MAAPAQVGALRALDAVLFTSVWVALAAALLGAASARALGLDPRADLVATAFLGTLAVYTVDRLRDVRRDRETAPARTRFIEAHAPWLTATAVAAGVAAGGLGLRGGPRVVALLAAVLALGLLHRRLKAFWLAKPFYLTVAWTAVAVALPALAGPGEPRHTAAVALLVASCVASNVVLSNLRDGEGGAARLGSQGALRVALGLLLPALALGLLGPDALRPLLPLPLAMAAAVIGFRPSERYGLLVVDGALALGALPAALGWLGAS